MKKIIFALKTFTKWAVGVLFVFGIGAIWLYAQYSSEPVTVQRTEPTIIEKIVAPTYTTDDAIALFVEKRDRELTDLAAREEALQAELEAVREREEYLLSF